MEVRRLEIGKLIFLNIFVSHIQFSLGLPLPVGSNKYSRSESQPEYSSPVQRGNLVIRCVNDRLSACIRISSWHVNYCVITRGHIPKPIFRPEGNWGDKGKGTGGSCPPATPLAPPMQTSGYGSLVRKSEALL